MTDADFFRLSPEKLQEIFDRVIRPDVFEFARAGEAPVVVLVGAQPGSGKTRAIRRIRREYAAVGTALIAVNGDALRSAHPAYRDLIQRDPTLATVATQHAMGVWVEKAIAHARASGYSVVIEGTFRVPETALGEADRFHAAGYRTHMVALAVPAEVSRLATLSRYVDDALEGKAARWTPVSSHDAGYAGAATTIALAQSRTSVDRLTVIDRQGGVLFDATSAGAPIAGAVEALAYGRRTPLDSAGAAAWLESFRSHVNFAVSTDLLSSETRPLFEQLVADARSMIALVTPGVGDADTAHERLDADVRRLSRPRVAESIAIARTSMGEPRATLPRHRVAITPSAADELSRVVDLER